MLNITRDDEKKIIVGSIIGGVVAVSALALYCASKKEKDCTLKTIGNSICQVLDKIEGFKEGANKAVHQVEEKIDENKSAVEDFFELASVGINLWKKMQKR